MFVSIFCLLALFLTGENLPKWMLMRNIHREESKRTGDRRDICR